MNGTWLQQSLICMLCLVPAWLSIGFFGRNFQVRPEVFLIWYVLGVLITSVFWGGISPAALVPAPKIAVAIVILGMALGGVANIAIFRAVASAPNPGLPVAIANMAGVGVFLASALLARALPNLFNQVKTDVWSFVGVVLAVIGASLIAIRR